MKRLCVFLLVLASLIVGCGSEGPYHGYNVYISSTFSYDETSSILAALDEWESVNIDVSFNRAVVVRPPKLDENEVYIGRATAGKDCLGDRNLAARGAVGLEYAGPLGGFAECLDADSELPLRQIALHETGHVLGFPHLNPPSVMTLRASDAAPHVTPQDVTWFNSNLRK